MNRKSGELSKDEYNCVKIWLNKRRMSCEINKNDQEISHEGSNIGEPLFRCCVNFSRTLFLGYLFCLMVASFGFIA